LIHGSIKTAWALELLLFIRRGDARAWTVRELAAELRTNQSLTTDILTSFKRAQLVIEESPGSFRYQPATAELADAVRLLDEIHAERPFMLMKEIVSAPNEKIRSFVEAFKLRKDKD
jgi:DNA-binding IclR family transcriptional regulator